MRRFLIIIEQGSHNYSAYVPDLPASQTMAEYVDITIPDPAA